MVITPFHNFREVRQIGNEKSYKEAGNNFINKIAIDSGKKGCSKNIVT